LYKIYSPSAITIIPAHYQSSSVVLRNTHFPVSVPIPCSPPLPTSAPRPKHLDYLLLKNQHTFLSPFPPSNLSQHLIKCHFHKAHPTAPRALRITKACHRNPAYYQHHTLTQTPEKRRRRRWENIRIDNSPSATGEIWRCKTVGVANLFRGKVYISPAIPG
jgi:hypothetical protein